MTEIESEGQLLIDGFPVEDRAVKITGHLAVPEDVYDTLQLGVKLRVVCEATVVSRRDKVMRDKWGYDLAYRTLGLAVVETRSAKLVTEDGEVV